MTNVEKLTKALQILTTATVPYIRKVMTEEYHEKAFMTALKNLENTKSVIIFKEGGSWDNMDLQACLTLMGKQRNLFQLKMKKSSFSYHARMFYYRDTFVAHNSSKPPTISNEDIVTYIKEIAVFCHPMDKQAEKEILAIIAPPLQITDTLTLKAGDKIPFQNHFKFSKDVIITMKIAGNLLCNFTCFALNQKNLLTHDKYMIFYNNLISENHEISLQESQNTAVFTINFSKFPEEIRKLKFVVSIDDEEGNMRKIVSHSVSITQEEKPAINLEVSGTAFSKDDKSAVSLEFFRNGRMWEISAPIAGSSNELGDYVVEFGETLV